VIWNGAIGHFSAADTAIVLGKIRACLGPSGVFAGSESLGMEGHDHHQFFDDELAVQQLFKPHFRHVVTRTVNYTIGQQRNFARREVFWRCSDSRESLKRDAWSWADAPANAGIGEG
jgi:hypothetical protein